MPDTDLVQISFRSTLAEGTLVSNSFHLQKDGGPWNGTGDLIAIAEAIAGYLKASYKAMLPTEHVLL
jgi:hypothetical protein